MDFFADHASLIRFIIIVIVVILLGGRQFWREFRAKSEELSDKPSKLLSQRFVSVLDLSREFLFADHTVEQHINDFYTQEPSRDDFDSSESYLFALYSYHTRKGNKIEARESLRHLLSLPDASSRSTLIAWKALRALGQVPNTSIARKPLGVVIELPVGKKAVFRKRIDMIAAYLDGTAEYISHNGEMMRWSTPDEESKLLTSDILRASEPIVRILPLSEYHRTLYKNLIRISILTPSGIRTAEAKPDGLRRDAAMASIVDAGRRLMETLITRGEKLGVRL